MTNQQGAPAAAAGCTRSHPHENMDSACRAKAAIAEMRNMAARGAEATAHDLERFVSMLTAALVEAQQPSPSAAGPMAPFTGISTTWTQGDKDQLAKVFAEIFGWPSTTPQADSQPAPVVDGLVATMLDALRHAQKVLNHNNLHLECGPVNAAILAARAPADSVTAPAGGVVGYRVSDPHEPDLGHWLSEEPGAAWCVSEPLALAPPTPPAQAADKQRARDAYADGMGDPLVRAAPQQVVQEPVAYAIFAENGNIRLWATEPQHVKRIAAEQGLSLVKLYTAPQPAPAPLSEREMFEETWEKAHGKKPVLWETMFAQQKQETPAHCVGRYYYREEQSAWGAWQARAALAAQGGK